MVRPIGLFAKMKVLLFVYHLVTLGASLRPIWNIAHMVNSPYQVDHYLENGANAIESDIVFSSDGTPLHTYHGFPCDCFRNCFKRENIDNYLRHIEELTNPSSKNFQSHFIMQMFDLKLKKLSASARVRAVQAITTKLVSFVWKKGETKNQLQFLYSIPSSDDLHLVTVVRETLERLGAQALIERIGWDANGNEDLSVIGKTYQRLNMTNQIWQGDGITNCLPRWTRRLRQAIRIRDNQEGTPPFMAKVYYWTVDMWSSLRSTLRLGVDAIITNHPERLSAILQEDEFRTRVRLATSKDTFWTKYVDSAAVKSSPIVTDFLMAGSDPKEEIKDSRKYY